MMVERDSSCIFRNFRVIINKLSRVTRNVTNQRKDPDLFSRFLVLPRTVGEAMLNIGTPCILVVVGSISNHT